MEVSRCKSLINHVLVNGKDYVSILDVTSMREAWSESDHFLIRAVVRERLNEKKKETL